LSNFTQKKDKDSIKFVVAASIRDFNEKFRKSHPNFQIPKIKNVEIIYKNEAPERGVSNN
jgi:hypothetical protein